MALVNQSQPAERATDELCRNYVHLATKNEDLKSEERMLAISSNNLKDIGALLIDKEKEFCRSDREIRVSSASRMTIKQSLRKRCFGLIDHLVHYKCLIECLSGDVLVMESSLLNDDEYVHLSLMFREAELAVLQAIKINRQRNEVFLNMLDEEAQSHLAEVEQKWTAEHDDRRRLISRLIIDQNQMIVDKTLRNLEQQQVLLNHRYQAINNLIKMSYSRRE